MLLVSELLLLTLRIRHGPTRAHYLSFTAALKSRHRSGQEHLLSTVSKTDLNVTAVSSPLQEALKPQSQNPTIHLGNHSPKSTILPIQPEHRGT